MLSDIDPTLATEMEKTKLLDLIGKENVFEAQPAFGASLDEALSAANAWLESHPQEDEATAYSTASESDDAGSDEDDSASEDEAG
jgi:SulP family sulfate permease